MAIAPVPDLRLPDSMRTPVPPLDALRPVTEIPPAAVMPVPLISTPYRPSPTTLALPAPVPMTKLDNCTPPPGPCSDRSPPLVASVALDSDTKPSAGLVPLRLAAKSRVSGPPVETMLKPSPTTAPSAVKLRLFAPAAAWVIAVPLAMVREPGPGGTKGAHVGVVATASTLVPALSAVLIASSTT